MSARLMISLLTNRAWLLGPALTTALVLMIVACGPDKPPAAPTAARVSLSPVTSGPAFPAVLTNGVIGTREELRLSFKVAGIVRNIAVTDGDTVRGGQTLATLELAEIDAQLEMARQLAGKAERDRDRAERLRADKVISAEELESLRTQAEVARAQLRTAEFNRRYAVIVAPRDGIVLRKLVEEREFVSAGQAVLLLGQLAGGYVVRASLADRDVVKLRLGDPATVTLDAWPGVSLRGSVTEIPGGAAENTGLFEIEIDLEPAPVNLVSGLVARLVIEPAAAGAATLPYVPIAAVIEADGDRAAVYVVENGIARRRPVRVAFIAPEAVALADGVWPGEQVVTDGALYLRDGERVEIVGIPSVGAAATPAIGAEARPTEN
jgi:RND family efflux transporter MFP subunit